MISNNGHDERGKYSGGQAGDQTGGEWRIQPWYSRPWTHVIRYPASTVRECIASLAEEAAQNDRIGYDQAQRTTFWGQLRQVGYHPSKIQQPCEADCSAGVAAIVKAAGFLLGIKQLQDVSADMYTGSERKILQAAGFQVLTEKEYLESDRYLLRGDILLCEGHHTAINLTDGPEVKKAAGWHWLKGDGIWYDQDPDGINSYGWKLIPETGGTLKHWYHFNGKGQLQTGAFKVGGSLFYAMTEGPLEGALCITDNSGALQIWDVK